MKALLSRGWLLGLIVVLLLALLIWFGGPYLGFGAARPLASVTGRLIALLVVVLVWVAVVQIKLLRAARSGRQLANAVAGQTDAPAAAADGSQSRDVRVLRERFQQAVAQLRKSKRAQNLYDLPWYMIIGPPGSGKTTALLNAGLHFPLEAELGRDPLKGVGGTRNCDWWITDEAILLDTAGRYVTQDSNEIADRAGWREFLALLRKYRGRRPVNGVLLTVSAADLLTATAEERERLALAMRSRLQELVTDLKVALPVYILVTKLDLVAGCNEFFDDLDRGQRAQVLGVTFPIEQSRDGSALRGLRGELDLLVGRLQDRVPLRMAGERDLGRRALIHAFPAQLAALERPLTDFLGEVVRGTSLATDLWIRGCYLTSGTQAGTPVDRMLAAMASQFGLGVNAQLEPGQGGKSYFLEALLKLVVFAESGVAGVNRRLELQRTALRVGAYAAVVAGVVLGIAALLWSYRTNRLYLTKMDQLAAQVLPATPEPEGVRIEQWVPRLDALRDVRDAALSLEESGVPWRMRWGLYQGRATGDAATDAYYRQLNARLGPWIGERFVNRLRGLGGDPESLYLYLRGYLMLSESARLDAEELAPLGSAEIRQSLPAQGELAERVAGHFSAWVGGAGRFQPIARDETLVEQASISLQTASLARLMYSRMRLGYSGQEAGQLLLNRELSVGGEDLFVRRSGKSLGEPLSALYTRAAFDDFKLKGSAKLLVQYQNDSWVLGKRAPPYSAQLTGEVQRLYEEDYIRAWDELLSDLTLRAARGPDDQLQMLAVLGGASSPLKRLLVLVDQNTNLLKADAQQNAAENALDAKIGALNAGLQKASGGQGAPQAKPGTLVTNHFQSYHRQLEGPPGQAPVDAALMQVAALQQELQQAVRGGGAGGAAAAAAAMDRLGGIVAQLPGPLKNAISQAGQSGAAVVMSGARTELNNRYVSDVVKDCRDLGAGRFPLARGDKDLAPGDFGRLFGTGGTYDRFFQSQLKPLVDDSRSTWRYKEGAEAGAGVPLEPFQKADRIRQAMFAPGSMKPELTLTLIPEDLDAEVDRFRLTVGTQTLEYAHGRPKPMSITWPGELGAVSVAFEVRGGARPNHNYPGDWGLFRLFDAAEVQALSDREFLLTIREGEVAARVRLSAASARNPFRDRSLLRFACGG